MKRLMFVVVVFVVVLCFPAKAEEGEFDTGNYPADCGFEYSSLDWWVYMDCEWETFPWPGWCENMPKQPWERIVYRENVIDAYPGGWFPSSDVPTRPWYFWGPSEQAWIVNEFVPAHWFTVYDIYYNSDAEEGMSEWIDQTVLPVEGERMLLLTSGPIVVPLFNWSLNCFDPYTYPDEYSASVHQYIYIRGGERISGEYNFFTCDYPPYGDYAVIKLIPFFPDEYPEIILAEEDTFSVGAGGNSGWKSFSYRFPDQLPEFPLGRAYYLICEVHDEGGDTYWPSILLVDDLRICSETFKSDLYRDCHVNMKDYARFAAGWPDGNTGPAWCLYDFDDNNNVDFNDLKIMAGHWMSGKR